MRLINEFAGVEIARDDQGNGPRLKIRDLHTGQEICLDPLELAALAWARHEELLPLIDPGRLERQAWTLEEGNRQDGSRNVAKSESDHS